MQKTPIFFPGFWLFYFDNRNMLIYKIIGEDIKKIK